MDLKKRVKLFLLLKVKMEEVMAIIDEHGARDEFLASYCFGLSTDTPLDKVFTKDTAYEFLAGFTADNLDEIDAMFEAMQRVYDQNQDSHGPSDSIDYWLNIN
jgi:hypothetical protein